MDESNLNSDPGSVELAESGGGEDASPTGEEKQPAVTLEQLNKMSGREFSSIEDFNKHYDNLKSYVGKKTEAPVPAPEPVAPAPAPQDEPVTRSELDLRDFKSAHPEALDRADDIQAIAKASDKTLEAAYTDSGIQAGIEAEQAREKAKNDEQTVGVTSASRVSSTNEDLAQVEAAYKENPTREGQEALVRAVLGTDNDRIRTQLGA